MTGVIRPSPSVCLAAESVEPAFPCRRSRSRRAGTQMRADGRARVPRGCSLPGVSEEAPQATQVRRAGDAASGGVGRTLRGRTAYNALKHTLEKSSARGLFRAANSIALQRATRLRGFKGEWECRASLRRDGTIRHGVVSSQSPNVPHAPRCALSASRRAGSSAGTPPGPAADPARPPPRSTPRGRASRKRRPRPDFPKLVSSPVLVSTAPALRWLDPDGLRASRRWLSRGDRRRSATSVPRCICRGHRRSHGLPRSTCGRHAHSRCIAVTRGR